MSLLSVKAPFDQSLIEELPFNTEDEAFLALTRAYALYQNRDGWLSANERREILQRLAQDVGTRREELALQAAREGGKPLVDSLAEIDRAQGGIEVAAAAISRLTGDEVPMNQGASSQGRFAVTYREPRGVVFAISAFNHPFNLLIHQVITAIAAGCPVLIKPAAATPLSCRSLMQMLETAGLPPGWCQMLLTSHEVTEKLVEDRRIAFLNFIGSGKIGWFLRSKLPPGAACVLEHGGVAPVIIDETADLEGALPLLTKGAFYHAGQVCVSVQRIYVHGDLLPDLAEGLVDAAQALIVGDPTEDTTEVGPLIRPEEVDRVHEWVTEAVAEGAKVLCGGKKLSATLYAPTVLLNPPDSARISQEEVFGPVVCLYSYHHIHEAVERANLEKSYFQAAYFTNRLDRAMDIGKRLHGMAVMINDHTAFRVDWMPFGGHRESGLGLGGIEHTMKDLSLERMLVIRQGI